MTEIFDFNSIYRNRNEWPSPAEYRVDISQSGTKTRLTAQDPISNAAAEVSFVSAFGSNVIASIPATIITVQYTDRNYEALLQFTAGQNQLTTNYYAGATLTIDGTSTKTVIASYSPRDGTSDAYITFTSAIGSVVSGTAVTITNPGNSSFSSVPTLFIPTGVGIDNYYIGYTVFNTTRNETRLITKYDGLRRTAVLDSPATAGWDSTVNEYFIRKEAPTDSGTVGASTTSTVTLGASASTEDNIYVNSFLRIGASALAIPYNAIPAPWNEVRKIISYNGTTKVATVSPAFSVAPGVNTYMVEQYSRDNQVPFNYTGTLSTLGIYEIELINVTIPNIILSSGPGGRIVFHPYVYVELTPVSSGTRSGPVYMYSNNPNALTKVFRAAVVDVPHPLRSAFIKLDGQGMVHRLFMRLSDSFLVKITLSNGTMIETTGSEQYGPLPPNPLIQTSVLFRIKRV